jgi:hypothetical protein
MLSCFPLLPKVSSPVQLHSYQLDGKTMVDVPIYMHSLGFIKSWAIDPIF